MDKAKLIERIRDLSSPMDPVPTGLEPGLKQLSGIQCVAFDFYGTMFISGVGDIGVDESQTGESRDLFRQALLDTGFEAKSGAAEEGLRVFEVAIGKYQKLHREKGIEFPEPDIVMIWYEVLEQLIEKDWIAGELDHETAQRFAVEYEFRFNAVWPVPDLDEILQVLKEQRYILGIISNSQFYTPLAFEALTSKSLTEAGFDRDLLVWSYRASMKKPSVHFYERFVRALYDKHNLKPGQVLYTGNDMLKDIKPASELGMKTALFAGDERSLKLRENDPDCENVEPDIIITELSQISECLPTQR